MLLLFFDNVGLLVGHTCPTINPFFEFRSLGVEKELPFFNGKWKIIIRAKKRVSRHPEQLENYGFISLFSIL